MTRRVLEKLCPEKVCVAVRGTMFVRNGAVTPGPSRECDITFFVKGRPKSAQQLRDSTVAVRRAQSVTVPSSRVSRECRSPGLRFPPPLKKCPSLLELSPKVDLNVRGISQVMFVWTMVSEAWQPLAPGRLASGLAPPPMLSACC